jgi:hypothetical protein
MKRSRESIGRFLCRASELSPATLTSGQAFRWVLDEEKKTWFSPLESTVFGVRWVDEVVEFEYEPRSMSEEQAREKLFAYFRLDVSIASLITEWKKRDKLFGTTDEGFGLRLLR